MTDAKVQLKIFNFFALPDDTAKLREIAASKGLSIGALIRLIIADYLKREARKARTA